MTVSGGEPARIFISYRRADASWPARALAISLARQLGEGVVFQDVDSIKPGDDFAAKIQAAVRACSVLLAVIGPRWLTAIGDTGKRLDDPRDFVRLEIETAIDHGIRVIPVLVDGARMPAAGELPSSLRELAGRQAVIVDPVSLDTRRLISAVETALTAERTEIKQAGQRTAEPAPAVQSRASRLLMNAIRIALMLRGKDRADALAAIIRASSVTASERAGWLAAEAENTARAIEDEHQRTISLARVAAAIAAVDPERGETIARSIEHEAWQVSALAEVVKVVAPVDPERGEAIARSMHDPFRRSWALADVAEAVARVNPERGEAIARSIGVESERPPALARVARTITATDPERAAWLAAEAEAVARSLPVWRSSSLSGVARAVAANDPERGEAIARAIRDAYERWSALAAIAWVAGANDPERAARLAARAEKIARANIDQDYVLFYTLAGDAEGTADDPDNAHDGDSFVADFWQGEVLANVAAAVAAVDPERGEAIARSIKDKSYRTSALSRVIRAVAAVDPERGEAIARSIEDAAHRASALSIVAEAVAAADPERGEAIARSIEDAAHQASALADLAHFHAQRGQL